jgi:dipeptidyl aminopeptidase/acylaminoacyl peptidase
MRRLTFLSAVFLLFNFSGCQKKVETDKTVERKAQKAEVKVEKKSKRSIADYVKVESSRGGFVLKDGRKLYLARKKNTSQLFLEDKEGKSKNITNQKEAVYQYSVSPSESRIAFQISAGGSEQDDIYLIELSTGEIKPLLKNPDNKYGNLVWINDNEFLYTSNEVNKRDFYIYHFDIDSMKSRLTVEKPGYNFVTDAISSDRFLFYLYKGNNVTVPYIYNGGKIKKIKGAGKGKSYIPVGFFGEDIVMMTNESQDATYLELWNKGVKKPLFKSNWNVEETVIDPVDRDRVVFCTNEEGYSSCYLFSNGQNSKINIAKSVVRISQFSGDRLVYLSNRPDEIPLPVLYSFSKGSESSFGYYDANGIDISSFVSPELRKVSSFDGVKIPYFLYIPKEFKPPYRTIVYYHGGPASQFRPMFIRTFQYYLKQGYMVVAPNVRGSSGYGQKYMDMDNYKKRMDSVKDGGAVINSLISEGLAQKDGFIAVGGSYGGFMVVASMAEYPDNYRGGVDSVGVVDFVNFLKNTKSYRRKLREVEYGPLSDPEFLKSISPSNMTDKIKGRLLIAHGANDPRVPLSDAQILAENMRKSGKKVETLIFDDEGHGFRKLKNNLIFYDRIVKFLEKSFK